MKVSSRNMLVLLAVVVSFVAVQAAWAAVDSGPYTIIGTIASMDGDCLVIDVDSMTLDEVEIGAETVKVYGMGPATYWASYDTDGDGEPDVAFPTVGDEVEITAYLVVKDDEGDDRYVAASVTVDGDTIELRKLVTSLCDKKHLIPLWSSSPQVPETETAVFSTTDADCTCDCKGDCDGDACDCTCDCEDCLEKKNQYRSGKDQ